VSLLPVAIGVAGWLYFAAALVFGGILVGCASLLPYTVFDEHTPYALIIGVSVVRGIGFGAIGLPLYAVAFSLLDEDHVRDASAQLNVLNRVGGSIGTAIATVVLQQALTHHARTPAGAAAAFRHTYWWLFIVGAIALGPALWLLLIERRERLRPTGIVHPSHAGTSAALESALEVL